MFGLIGAAIVVVVVVFWGWSKMKGTEKSSNRKQAELPSGITWSHEFAAVSDLTATSSGLAASVVIDRTRHLVGLEAEGRLSWRKEIRDDGMLVAGRRSLFAVTERRIMRIDPPDGSAVATRELDPPLGGWAKGTILSIGDDLLVVHAGGLARIDASDLETQWQVTLALDDENDTIQQLVHDPPWIAIVSNDMVMVISDRGELSWKRRLPHGTRLAGSSPLVLAYGRVLLGLVRMSEPGTRYLYELSVAEGQPGTETVINDLAMFCRPYVSNGVLVLDTQGGLAGFDIENDLQRLWSIEAPIALGTCVSEDGHLVVATRIGELLRVVFANGQKETLVRLPQRLAWVRPAPDLQPGVHSESAGAIERLALLPRGVAFSVSWSNDHASILFHPW